MKFEKITNTKIKVVLNLQDIKSFDISEAEQITFNNFPSSQKLLQTMLQQAEEELGFKSADSKLLVEALMSSNHEYIFIITKLVDELATNPTNQNSFIIKFKNFDEFVALCTFLNTLSDLNLREFSMDFSLALYKNTYYLCNLNTKTYPILFDYMKNVFSEFGTQISNSNYIEGILNEYGRTIFENNAIINCILYFV